MLLVNTFLLINIQPLWLWERNTQGSLFSLRDRRHSGLIWNEAILRLLLCTRKYYEKMEPPWMQLRVHSKCVRLRPGYVFPMVWLQVPFCFVIRYFCLWKAMSLNDKCEWACIVLLNMEICRGHVEKIKVLVENGVDCSIGDYDQRTVCIGMF